MTKPAITPDKAKLLDGLLDMYAQEIEAVYAIFVSWNQLKDAAKDKCSDDFDQALIARETLLEELADLRDAGITPEYYEIELGKVDSILLSYNAFVKDIYGLDAKSFLNVKQPKALQPAKKSNKSNK
jgi:hypothetical protein